MLLLEYITNLKPKGPPFADDNNDAGRAMLQSPGTALTKNTKPYERSRQISENKWLRFLEVIESRQNVENKHVVR